jgi:branched-chain amino acid transport system permease protein
VFVNYRLRDSRVGRAWIALREDEEAAACAGVPIVRTKLLAYGVGAALGGISGAFLASYYGTVSPSQFTFSFSIFILAMIVVGGLGSTWGVVLGAIILSGINSYLLQDVPSSLGLDFDLSNISAGVYGFLLVTFMLLRPDGLLPEPRHRIR